MLKTGLFFSGKLRAGMRAGGWPPICDWIANRGVARRYGIEEGENWNSLALTFRETPPKYAPGGLALSFIECCHVYFLQVKSTI